MIRNFFIRQGVAFGTDREIDSYPGETFKDEGIVTQPIKNREMPLTMVFFNSAEE